MSDKIRPSFEELISALEHSNLPTVIVEGEDDIIVYRTLDEKVDGIDVIDVGGRDILLKIYRQKLVNNNLKDKIIIFIADKDIWCNIGIPAEYETHLIVFTSGYSIENDLFVDFECQKMIKLDTEANNSYEEQKAKFIKWYALALQHNLNSMTTVDENEIGDKISKNINFKDRKISIHPDDVIKNFNEYTSLKPGEVYPESLEQALIDDFPMTIRGKSILDLFTMSFKSGLRAQTIFKNISARPGKNINRIFEDVEKCYNSLLQLENVNKKTNS